MPGRPHHSDKMRSCVEQLQAKGKDKATAFAICTASLQKAGEEIFAAAQEGEQVDEDLRYVTLLGATGEMRVAEHDGRPHYVVPVVALVEGVIHPVNAPTKEFVSASLFETSAPAWSGRPAFAGHPVKEGALVSGNLPDVLPSHIGRVFNARAEGKRLLMDAWIDPARIRNLDSPEGRVLQRVMDMRPIEVSVGCYVHALKVAGEHNGKKYEAEWKSITPDHLALLDERQVGACSIAMGCGALRANRVNGDAIEALSVEQTLAALRGSDMTQKKRTLTKRILEALGLSDLLEESETVGDGNGTPERKAACGCGGTHDTCTCDKKPAASPEQGEPNMERKDRIAALTANPHSTVKSPKMLEAATDDELTQLETEAKARKDAEAETARLKAENEALKANTSKPLSEEEFMKQAPQSIRDLVVRTKTADDARKTTLVGTLKDAQKAYTEDELKALSLADLEKLAIIAKSATAQPEDDLDGEVFNFSGRAIPRHAAAGDDKDPILNPPDPYRLALEKRQPAAK
jgi:DnaJ-domain-containing protein 1